MIKDLIKQKRLGLKESQTEFGKRFGVSHASISDIERGKTSHIPIGIVEFIVNPYKDNRFRKKPVVIDAVQWTGKNFEEVMIFIQDGHKDYSHLPKNGYVTAGVGYTPAIGQLTIPTLEGNHEANIGDWIIKGVKGEFYPCKPDIFEMTYEKV